MQALRAVAFVVASALGSGCISYSVITKDFDTKKFIAASTFDLVLPPITALAPLEDDGKPWPYWKKLALWFGSYIVVDAIIALVAHCTEPNQCEDEYQQ
jgi:hypothetical protein